MKLFTYENFLNSAQDVSDFQFQENAEIIIDRFRPAKQTGSHYAPVTFLLDYSTKKYIYVNEACFDLLGYTANYFLETGLKEYLSRWHEADFSVINTKIFPDNMKFLRSLQLEQYSDFIFSYNYRMRNANDEYITVLQRFSYIPGSEAEKPCGMIGVIFDITHFKNDLSVVHTIEKSAMGRNGIVNELVFKKVHPVYEMEIIPRLSKREIEIIKHISRGLSSKQIADKMDLSINTISNHRKNMLAKVACKTSSELMSFSIKHGLV
jgi:DNA-binding CsgD family transcriptional regulator